MARVFNAQSKLSDDSSENITTKSEGISISISNKRETANKIFFDDNKREIDFILVFHNETLDSTEQRTDISTFITSLEKNGLECELETGTVFSNLQFIKIHGPYNVLLRYASAFKMRLAFRAYDRPREPRVHFKFMTTPLTRPDPNSPIFRRAKETMSGERPTRMTKTERIIIVDTLLQRAPFGSNNEEYGLAKMLAKKAFVAAYPLHDGKWQWTEDEPLNDRQLLGKYWARIRMWYKQQPLNVIEKYYGPEVAFYFAFCGFYNRMLVPASIVGIFCFVFGFVAALIINKNPIEEICSSDLPLCPVFFKKRNVTFRPLKDYCFNTKLTFMFDNDATIFFAFFMAFWATTFMELWKRKHNILMYNWNLRYTEDDLNWRREFQEHTKYRRVCPITGTLEPYVPKWLLFLNYSLTFITCLVLISIVVLAVMASILYRLVMIEIIQMSNASLFSMITGAILSVTFIKVFGKWYGKIAMWLTKNENPRTQSEFDDSYIYKIFLLSFVNNYAAVSHIAFIKGKLYTYPGDSGPTLFATVMRGDLCHPAGCIMGVCIILVFIMLLKSLAGNIFILFSPPLKKLYRKYIHKKEPLPLTTPQWELDYELKEMGHYFLVGEYLEMIMQYGFVTFFVAAFPLAPLCAFINNMIELRADASKFVKYCRRPVPVKKRGLEAWNGILQAMTFMSMVTNAFVIAFTSDFVKREIYRHHTDYSLKGYVNSTLSIYDTADFKHRELASQNIQGICYYRGNRYPPDNPQKYEITSGYWYELSIRFVVAVIFEHLILTLTGILGYAIPDMPENLKKNIKHQRYKRRLERIKAVDNVGDESHKRRRSTLILP